MKAMIYGTAEDHNQLMQTMRAVPQTGSYRFSHTDDYDTLRRELAQEIYSLVIITANGAAGMEACIGVRKLRPSIPLFWFSDDVNFGPQSYRLECTYFCIKPISEHRLKNAFCRIME